MTGDDPLTEAAIDAMLRLAAGQGWLRTTLGDIARAAEIPVPELRRRFPCKARLLLAYARRIETTADAQPVAFDAGDGVRDRLFELLMQRLDLLDPDRAGVAAILRDLPLDPVTLVAVAPAATRLLAGVLEAAGVASGGPAGLLRRKGLGAIWLRTLTVWAEDDSADKSRTMAVLDRMLRQSEPAARVLAALSCPGASAAAGATE